MAIRKRNRKFQKLSDADHESSASGAGKSGFRRWRLMISTIVFAVIALAWILRVVPHQCISRAKTAMESWRFEEAKRQLQNYPTWGTDAGRVYFLRARIDWQQSGYARAMEHLRSAKTAGFDFNAIRREQMLMVVQNGGLSPNLMSRLESILKQSPADQPIVYQVFANALFQAGNASAAQELLDRWSEEYPHDGRPHYWKGYLWHLLEDADSALAMYAESTNRDAQLVESYVEQAAIWSDRADYDQAEKVYRRACAAAPDRLDTRIAWGKTLWKMHRKSEAAELLEPIVEQQPTVYPIGRLVAQYYAEQKDCENVIATLRPMMETYPDDATLNYMLASAHHEVGNKSESRAAMEKFLVANESIDRLRSSLFDVPPSEQYSEALRRALAFRRYDWKRSMEWLTRAAQIQPDSPEPHAFLARHYRELGATNEAVHEQNTADTLTRAR